MAGVGGVASNFVKGHIRDLKTRVTVYQQPGFGGYGAHRVGRGDSDFVFVAVLYDKSGPVETWINAVEALQGTIISIVDDFNVVHLNCLVTHVGRPRKTTAIRPQDPVTSGVRAQITISGRIV